MLEVSGRVRSGRISCLNWPDTFPYRPEADFSISHSGEMLHLSFRVREQAVLAAYSADRDPVYRDSCVEFFFAPCGDGRYYNLECNCIGKLLLCVGTGRHGREPLPDEAYAGIRRSCSLGEEAFSLREGPLVWSVALDIPAATFGLDCFSGLRARGNFYKCGDALPVPHYLSWAPIHTPKPDFHRPDFFDSIIFQ